MIIRYLLTALLTLFVILWLMERCKPTPLPKIKIETDTVIKYVPLEVPSDFSDGVVAAPRKVTLYKKPNLPLRQALEKKPIIAGMTVSDKGIEILRLDSAGGGVAELYTKPWDLAGIPAFKMDTTGRVIWDEKAAQKAVKKQRWRNTKRTIVLVGVGVVGFFAGRELSKD